MLFLRVQVPFLSKLKYNMSNYQAEDADAAAAYMDHVVDDDDDMEDVDDDLDDDFHGDDMAASDSDVDEFDYSVSYI